MSPPLWPGPMTEPLLPAKQHNVPSLFLRAERHTGSNFLEEILRINFKRSGGDNVDDSLRSQYAAEHPSCSDNRLSVGAPCYLPSSLFSGCDTRGHEGDENFCCWKHGYACKPMNYWPASTVLVVLVRSPYSFLPALHKMPYETTNWDDMSFSQFLRRPWRANPDYYQAYETADNPIGLWVKKMRSYRQYPHPTVVLRTSDLFDLASLEERLSKLDSHGFVRQHSPVRYPDFSDDAGENGKWSGRFSKEGFEKAREATLQENYIKEYTQQDLEWVNAELDRLSDADALLAWAQIERVRTVPASGGGSTKRSNLVTLNTSAGHSLPDAIQLFDASWATRR